MAKSSLWVAGIMGLALSVGGLKAADKPAEKPAGAERQTADKTDAGSKETKKQAAVKIAGAGDMKDKVKGNLTLTEVADGVMVKGKISGLTPGKHGIHIHEKGDLSDPKLTSAGGHFNPDGHKHGGPSTDMHHAGDWGNIEADDKGVANVEGTFKGVSIDGEKNGVMGRSIIVHAKEDDLKTDPSGNSGDRIAGGVIEAKKMKEKK